MQNKSDFQCLVKILQKTLLYFEIRRIHPHWLFLANFLIASNQKEAEIIKKSDFGDLQKSIKKLVDNKKIVLKQGSYIHLLNPPSEISPVEEEKIVTEKLKRVKKIVKILKYLPGLQFIAVTGTLASGNAREKSDLDFLVVTKQKRIFLVRLFLIIALELIGKRKKKGFRRNRVCLNYFMSEEDLKFKEKDLYSAFEITNMIVFLDKNKIYKKIIKANSWIFKYFPNFLSYKNLDNQKIRKLDFKLLDNYFLEKPKKSLIYLICLILDKIFSFQIFDLLENLAGYFQKKRIKRKRKKETGGFVYVSHQKLIFHPKPKSKVYQKKFREVLKREEIF
jgi:predicted nucleotidyltransferase